jgi:putative cell wall-binding protein
VLARSDRYPDALAGAPLAHDLSAPLLLTPPTTLHPDTEAEIDRLGVRRVVLVGGDAAVGPTVAQALERKGLTVDRVSGSNRFATAAAVAAELGADHQSVFVTEGANADPARGWPDAMSAAPYAAFTGRPILLTTQGRLPIETERALAAVGATETVVVGGPSAVGGEVMDALRAQGAVPRRLSGATRFLTGLAVYDEAVAAGMDADRLWLATGRNFPDALAAGPAVSALGDSFLLIDGLGLAGSPQIEQLIAARSDDYERIYLVGGPGVITAGVEATIRGLVR